MNASMCSRAFSPLISFFFLPIDIGETDWTLICPRQIRNVVQTAVALAEYEAKNGAIPSLNRSQFEKVAQASREFDEYLLSVYKGRTQQKLAHDGQVRDDLWPERKAMPRIVKPATMRKTPATAPVAAQGVQIGKFQERMDEDEDEDDDDDDDDDVDDYSD